MHMVNNFVIDSNSKIINSNKDTVVLMENAEQTCRIFK